jgi:hypothetical protein
MAAPPLTPGCLVMWQDNTDKFHCNLVVQFSDDTYHGYYTVLMIKDQRLVDINLMHEDNNKRWRVLHSAR